MSVALLVEPKDLRVLPIYINCRVYSTPVVSKSLHPALITLMTLFMMHGSLVASPELNYSNLISTCLSGLKVHSYSLHPFLSKMKNSTYFCQLN
jgi:hypothetical protein